MASCASREGVTTLLLAVARNLVSQGRKVVLVDANSVLNADDVRLVEMLVATGARAMVVLSKADCLAPDDRALVLAYTRERLAVELGFEVPVHLASVIGADAQLADRWIESILDPLLASQVGQRAGVLAAKTERLRMAVLQALRGGLQLAIVLPQ